MNNVRPARRSHSSNVKESPPVIKNYRNCDVVTGEETMRCKCVKCDKRYDADVALQQELTRFYLAHRRKIPAEVPWICNRCWETFGSQLLESSARNSIE